MKVAVLVVLGVVLLALAMLFLLQGNLIYFPQRYASQARPLQVVERVTYPSGGRQQSIYLYPKERAEPPRRVWWLFGGNGSVALNWVDLVAAAEPGVGQAYVLFDYPGYGFSGGRPSPKSIAASVDASLVPVAERLGLTVEELTGRSAAMGHSLGASVALDTASRLGFGDVVLISPFTTMKEMARRQVGPFFGFFLTHHYDNEASLDRWLESPKSGRCTVFHGDRDRIIPFSMGESLAKRVEAAGKGAFVRVPSAGHNDIIDGIGGRLVSLLESGREGAASGE